MPAKSRFPQNFHAATWSKLYTSTRATMMPMIVAAVIPVRPTYDISPGCSLEELGGGGDPPEEDLPPPL